MVAGVGWNMPRIQIESRPLDFAHALLPVLTSTFWDSKATSFRPAGRALPRAFAAASRSTIRTVRSMRKSKRVPL